MSVSLSKVFLYRKRLLNVLEVNVQPTSSAPVPSLLIIAFQPSDPFRMPLFPHPLRSFTFTKSENGIIGLTKLRGEGGFLRMLAKSVFG